MKLSEIVKISESPEFRNEVMPRLIRYNDSGDADSSASEQGNVIRNYKIIGTFWDNGIQAYTMFNKKIPIAHVCIRQFITNGDNIEQLYSYICTAEFKKHPTIEKLPYPLSDRLFLQERHISTVPKYEGRGLANHIYAALISEGYVIVSDEVHYLGGKQLWKKIARTKKQNYNYLVYVYDVNNNQYISDASGNPIEYDSTNISDNKIWFDGTIGSKYLLVAAGI